MKQSACSNLADQITAMRLPLQSQRGLPIHKTEEEKTLHRYPVCQTQLTFSCCVSEMKLLEFKHILIPALHGHAEMYIT